VYHNDRTRSQLVKFALEHVRAEVVELWSLNFKSRVIDDDEPATRDLPWLISFCAKNTGLCFTDHQILNTHYILNNLQCSTANSDGWEAFQDMKQSYWM